MPTSKQLIICVVAAAAAVAMLYDNDVLSSHRAMSSDAHMVKLGYLSLNRLPDSLALLPPPPAPGSARMRRDEEVRQLALPLRGSARYALASADAVVGFPQTPQSFSCALGIAIDKQRTPRLYQLLGNMLADVRMATYRAKIHYKRARPFVIHNTKTCHPQDEAQVRTDGSYPSGQAAVGSAYAVVLAKLNAANADVILERGREFGESRVVCDAQWQSDVDAGRVIGLATVRRMNDVKEFRDDLAAARAEVVSSIRSGNYPSTNCLAESTALASR
jgi:acid phosphatase (class A)